MAKARPKSNKRRALGKGLGALLPNPPATSADVTEAVIQIPVAKIDPNPLQPRVDFDDQALRDLATSIQSDGVLQPVVVQRDQDRYILVVGERRLKACRLAGLPTVPAIIRNIESEKLLEVTLVENIQRENLNPLEIAAALDRMIADLGLIHEELAERTGMSRTSITNHLRLLKLPLAVKDLLRKGQLQMGHARALLAIDNESQQEALAHRAVEARLAVREVERLVRNLLEPKKRKEQAPDDPNVAAALGTLERILQAPVRVRRRGKKGRLEISFSSDEDLAAIYDRIVGDSE